MILGNAILMMTLYFLYQHFTTLIGEVMSLKGRLPEIMQSTYTLSCDIIQIHSLIRHGFIKKTKSKFNRNRK